MLIYFQWKLNCGFQDTVWLIYYNILLYNIFFLIDLIILLFSFVDSDKYYFPVEFVTLKDGSEGLIVYHKDIGENKDVGDNKDESSYKFLDPFHPSDAIDITDIYIKN